jgi:uncharacterized iron-regulated membrane protein
MLSAMLYAFDLKAQFGPESAAVPARPPRMQVNLDSLLVRTRAHIPGIDIRYLNFPRTPGAPVTVMGDTPGGWLWGELVNYVESDYTTGEAQKIFREAELSPGEKVEYALYTLHYGQYGGKAIKALYAFFGLAGAVITVTGFLLWWRRQRPARSKRLTTGTPRTRYATARISPD